MKGTQRFRKDALDAVADRRHSFAYHSNAFEFGTLAPAIPQGAGSARAAVAQGIAFGP